MAGPRDRKCADPAHPQSTYPAGSSSSSSRTSSCQNNTDLEADVYAISVESSVLHPPQFFFFLTHRDTQPIYCTRTRQRRPLRGVDAVSKTLIARPPGPAMKDLLGSTTPNLCRDRRVEAMVNRLCCYCTPPSRYSFGECAKDGDSASMRPTIGAPDDRRVFNILAL